MQSNLCVTEVAAVGVIIEPPENIGKKVHVKCQTVLDRNIKIVNDDKIECGICKCELPSIEHISAHIEGKQHKNTLKQQEKSSTLLENTTCLPKDKQTLSNHATVLENGGIYCKVCDRQIDSMFNYTQHVKGKGHLTKLKNHQTKDSIYNIHVNNVGIEDLPENLIRQLKPKTDHIEGHQLKNNLKQQEKSSTLLENTMCLQKDKQTLSNHATVLENGVIYCKVCDRRIDSMFNYTQHVKGKGHLTKLKNHQTKDSEYNIHVNNVGVEDLPENLIRELKPKTDHIEGKQLKNNLKQQDKSSKLLENTTCLQKDKQTLLNHATVLENGIIYCKVCDRRIDSMFNYTQHVKGKGHLSELKNHQTKDSEYNIHVNNVGVEDLPENLIRELKPKTDHIEGNQDENNLKQQDKSSKLLENTTCLQKDKQTLLNHATVLENGVIYCKVCDRRIDSMFNYTQHVKGKGHLTKLKNHQTEDSEYNIHVNNVGVEDLPENLIRELKPKTDHIEGHQHKNNLKQQDKSSKLLENTTCLQKDKQTLSNHATVLENGIYCKVCDRQIDSMFNYTQHVKGKGHLTKLKNHQTKDSEYNIHVNNVGVEDLPENLIRELKPKTDHIEGHQLKNNLKQQDKSSKVLENTTCLQKDKQTLLNHATVLENGVIYCKVCDRQIDSMFNYTQHVKGKGHLTKLKNHQTKDSEYNIHVNNVGVEDLPENLIRELKPKTDHIEGHQLKNNLKQQDKSSKLLENTTCLQKDKQTLLNHATVLENGVIYCKVCDRRIDSMFNYTQHVKGKGHLTKLKNHQTKDSEYNMHVNNVGVEDLPENLIRELKPKTDHIEGHQHKNNLKQQDKSSKVLENTTCLQKDKQTLLNHATVLENGVIYCKVCDRRIDSLFNYSQHVKGRGHLTELKDHQTKDSEYKIHANNVGVDDLPENPIKELKHKTKRDHKEVQNNMYNCELCNERISINDLSTHINTHWDDQYLNSTKILYKCVCCKSIIDGDTLLICHIRKNTHVHNLRNCLEHIEEGNSEIHATNKGQDASEEKNSSVFTRLSRKVENTSAHFDEKCLISLDKVHYSCTICREEFSGIQSVILHCETKMHRMNIEQLFSGGEVKNDNNTAVLSLLNYFHGLYIIDSNRKIQTSDASVTDLAMSNAVCKQIMEKIKESPLISPPKSKHSIVKPKKIRLTDRLNKPYYMKYFQLENEMYTITKEKIDEIKQYFEFFIRYDKHIYCMVCKTKVSENLDLLYEHTRLLSHRANVKMETKQNNFIKQYIKMHMPNNEKENTQESSKKVAKVVATCEICKVHLKDVDTIKCHIECLVHKQNREKNYEYVNITVDSILKNFSDLYYSIQRYACVKCSIKFSYKMEFLQHIDQIHSDILKKKDYMFDFCIPCATLWFSKNDSFEGHCKDIVHKYLLKSNDFMVEDVPKCIITMLKQADRVTHLLLKEVNRVTEDHVKEEVRESVETKAKLCYSQAKAFLFGSRDIGLGFINCDIDIYIDTGNKYYTNNNAEKEELLRIQEAISIDEDIWKIKEILLDCRVPIIKLIYKPKNLDCDISFLNGLSVEKSKLIRSFNNACLSCKKLTVFIKKWLSFINLRRGHNFSNFALYWFVIYYLQEKKHLPSIAELINEHESSEFIGDWPVGFASVKCKNNHEDSVTVLLHGFFEFYGNFDYQYYIICPFMGSLIAKTDFTELNKLPRAMDTYIKHLKTAPKCEFFRIDSPLCVQDPIILSNNVTKGVSSITLKYFRQYCKECAAILKLRVT